MRLVILSNRIPYTFTESSTGLERSNSSGGLVTALNSLLVHEQFRQTFNSYAWYGWPGNINKTTNKLAIKQQLLKNHYYPVFIGQPVLQGAYSGFSNRTLWPLFHEFPLYARYNTSWWNYYVKYNAIFFDSIKEHLRAEDIIWVHDYHLLLVPSLLKNHFPKLPVGFFLHTPFPSSNHIDLLPTTWRKALLRSLLLSDLIGFQTEDHRNNFVNTVAKYKTNSHKMLSKMGTPHLNVGHFPIGIDYEKFHEASLNNNNEMSLSQISDKQQKIILSVSRLDYTKGLEEALIGYEKFLSENEHWHGKVIFILLIVPSRLDIDENIQIRQRVGQLVGQINGRFSRLNWNPILYLLRQYPFETLVSLYKRSDIALITSLRDGMNLISKEFIASKSNLTGVLILSKLAGAANELEEAILINPYNEEEVALAIIKALEMDVQEQKQRLLSMQKYLKKNNVINWTFGFIKALQYNYKLKRDSPPC